MKHVKQRCNGKIAIAAFCLAFSGAATPALAQRLIGIDVSAWQGNISAANWATLKRATNIQVSGINGDGRDFVLIRSSRGGTTGYYDQNDSANANGLNNFSQRYDDPYFIQNINRATSAGLWAGSYHFARPDVIASTLNSGGIANSGTDEADHFIQMAGPWMRPGFLPPVLDLEAGQSQRTSAELTTFCIDFSDRIYQSKGIRPMIYINGSYANYVQTSIAGSFPQLWTARWPNQADPNSILVQTAQPKDSYAPIYGPWDDAPNPTHPWTFWQYASTAHVNAIGNGTANVDVDAIQGGMEFLKDQLVPALWLTNSDGQWTTLTNWNSGLTATLPVPGAGQVTPVGTLTLPAPRLPGANDTVILDRPGANITVTLSSGTQNIRKLYMRETLMIAGGSLTVNYVPTTDSTPIAAQFSGPVTLNGGAFNVHTLQVDALQTFALGGGTLAFNTLKLMPNNSTPAKLLVTGNVSFNAVASTVATVTNGTGTGTSGSIDLGGAARSLAVGNGIELVVGVPIANGGITKAGTGSMRLTTNNTYTGDTVIATGTLFLSSGASLANSARIIVSNSATLDVSAKASGLTFGAAQTLAGNGSVVGKVTISGTISPGASIGALDFNTNLTLNGTTLMEISRNSGVITNDVINCGGTLTYNGALVVTNIGPDTLQDGDMFQLFSASAKAGAFSSTNLPPLAAGFRWDTSDLGNGTIKVIYAGIGQPMFYATGNSRQNMDLSGTNGIFGATYYVLSATNLSLPLTNWTRILTNVYGPGGSFSNKVPIAPDEESRYFLLQTPQ